MVEETPTLEQIAELNPDAIVLDGLHGAIVGIGYSKDLEPRLIYSIETIILTLMGRDKMTEQEAIEFYDYNIADGYFGKHGPIFLEKPTQQSSEVIGKEGAIEFNNLPSKSSTPTMTYAGVGSRVTPASILKAMTDVAKMLESKGYTLNTGKTFRNKEEGADKAFSDGTTQKNLFSPEVQGSRIKEQTVAKEMHPAPSRLKSGGLKLMARNTNQIFGDNLDTPVDFVLFYAKETDNPLRPKGGTGQAVEMARRKGIPTINMTDTNWKNQLEKVLELPNNN